MEGRPGAGEINGRRSDVWRYFVPSRDGEGKDVGTCINCQKTLRAETRNGTNHLKRHIDSCTRHGPLTARPQRRRLISSTESPALPTSTSCNAPNNPNNIEPSLALAEPAQATSWFNQEESGAALALMIAFHGYPSSIVEDGCFRSFVRALNPHFQMPSRAAVEGICRLHAEDAMNQLKETLASNQGQISLATGTAHTAQGKALYMAWQFIDDEWALQKRIAQVFTVVSFPPYHHDTLLGSEEVSTELDEGILQQLSVSTTTTTLKEAVLRWVLPGRLFSVAWGKELEEHLAQKDFLKNLCPETNRCSEKFDVPRVFCVTYTSDVLNSVADAIFSKLSNSYREDCFKAVRTLTLNQDQRDQILSDLGLKDLGRYDKRWFSYYCALEMLHKEYSANNATSAKRQELDTTRIGELLRQSKYSDAELRTLLGLSIFEENILTNLLRNIMGMIYRSLVTISSPGRPTSSLCLHEVMKLRNVLQDEAMEAKQVAGMAAGYAKSRGFARDEDVVSALEKAQGILDKFLQDSCQYLSIPVVLDPRFKLQYIEKIFVEEVYESDDEEGQACVQKVRATLQFLFNEHKRKRSDVGGDGTSSSMAVGRRTAAADADSILDERTTELQHYLQDGLVPGGDDGFDVIRWWSANSGRYPTVARMARDALTMPASDTLTPEDVSKIRSMVCWSYGNGNQ